MANPYGITQVDIPSLLGFDQQMKAQRLEQLYRQKQVERQDKLDERADREYNRSEQVRSGLTQAYDPVAGKIDPAKARSVYVGAGDIAGAMAFDKSTADQRQADLKNWSTLNEYSLQLLGGVHDQATYDAAKAQAKAIYDQFGQGQHFPELPPVYSPETVQRLQAQSLSAKEQLELAMKRDEFSEKKRHNQAVEGTAAGNLALSRQRESRVTKWGPQAIVVGQGVVPSSTSDLDY